MLKSKIYILLLIFTLIFEPGCKLIKTSRLLNNAEVNLTNRATYIDIEQPFNLIIFKVKISDKSYRFVFDTGAGASAVSKELANELKIKKVSEINVRDALNSSSKLDVCNIDSIYLNDVQYKNCGVIVSDLRAIPEFNCLNIDGVFGINLIRLTNWKIDYDESTIVPINFSEKIDTSIVSGYIKLDDKAQMPYTNVIINSKQERFLIDLGKNSSYISVSLKNISFNNPLYSSIGFSAIGLHGSRFDTTNYYKTDLTFNSKLSYSSQTISQSKNDMSLIGNGYLKDNFQVLWFDFKNHKLYYKQSIKNLIPNYSFGFNLKLINNNKIVIGAKTFSSIINIGSIHVGDTLLKVNSIECIPSNYCQIIEEIAKAKKISKTIKLESLKNKKPILSEVTNIVEQ